MLPLDSCFLGAVFIEQIGYFCKFFSRVLFTDLELAFHYRFENKFLVLFFIIRIKMFKSLYCYY